MTMRPQNGCQDCGHTWFPRGGNLSKRCPECHSENTAFLPPPPAPPSSFGDSVLRGCLAIGAILVLTPIFCCMGISFFAPKQPDIPADMSPPAPTVVKSGREREGEEQAPKPLWPTFTAEELKAKKKEMDGKIVRVKGAARVVSVRGTTIVLAFGRTPDIHGRAVLIGVIPHPDAKLHAHLVVAEAIGTNHADKGVGDSFYVRADSILIERVLEKPGTSPSVPTKPNPPDPPEQPVRIGSLAIYSLAVGDAGYLPQDVSSKGLLVRDKGIKDTLLVGVTKESTPFVLRVESNSKNFLGERVKPKGPLLVTGTTNWNGRPRMLVQEVSEEQAKAAIRKKRGQ